MLALAPRLTLGVIAVPVAAGLAGTVWAAAGGFGALADWQGLPRAMALSLGTGLTATALSLGLCLLLLAAGLGRPAMAAMRRLLTPLLAVPHAAAALGLAFLIAPSGWILRALSPWATGFTAPPDLLIVNDPMGLALTAGLVAKELPFLLLMALAALPQTDADRRMTTAATMGYGRVAGFLLCVLPALYPRLRLAVLAVLAYAMTAVDMALILGPTLPPTLSQQVVIWAMAPGLDQTALSAAGAVMQSALVLGAVALWCGLERALRLILARWAWSGWRGAALDRVLQPVALGVAMGLGLALGAGMAGLVLWSLAADWRFPALWPAGFTLAQWSRALPDLAAVAAQSTGIALAATLVALTLTLACLEAEARLGLKATRRAMVLLFLPLTVPQVSFLPGLQVLALSLGAKGSAGLVAALHLVFVLPYVFLSLAPAFRGLDPRLFTAARALGAGEDRLFWTLRLPMLLSPILTAAAVGLAVSVGQYLPTLLIGGGRVDTITTEAVALASGGNRRIIGTYAALQLALPSIAFLLALVLPRLIWANRRGLLA